ncbi:hypothetical protein AB0F91_41900 [Amycolatopsis sp. NPDC023774]|uniref:hypothetical protein n=1 Tax=Amycolatopsis sp. NPDC023774 TaxID=3155015 RepID=UPI0033CD4E62
MPPAVARNYSGPYHYERRVFGSDHIIARTPSYAGLRCALDQALRAPAPPTGACSSPITTPRRPASPPERCLRTAYRIAGLEPLYTLLHPEFA